jgi:hypothetical protein
LFEWRSRKAPPCRGVRWSDPLTLEHGRCVRQATQLWSHWQALLEPCADAFSSWGFQRFTEWLTGLALTVEEHTITPSLVALGRPQDGKALESFTETGAWDQEALERATARLLDEGGMGTGSGAGFRTDGIRNRLPTPCQFPIEGMVHLPGGATLTRRHRKLPRGQLRRKQRGIKLLLELSPDSRQAALAGPLRPVTRKDVEGMLAACLARLKAASRPRKPRRIVPAS